MVEPRRRGTEVIVAEVDAISLDGMKKEARAGMRGAQQFTIVCDEGDDVGGTETAPTPLTYFAVGVAF